MRPWRPLLSDIASVISPDSKTFSTSKFSSHTRTLGGLSGQPNLYIENVLLPTLRYGLRGAIALGAVLKGIGLGVLMDVA